MCTDSSVQREPSGETLEGWSKIAAHVTKQTGLTVSIACVQRWAKRADDPLPVRRWACGQRSRILADTHTLDRWIDRHWQEAASRAWHEKMKTDGGSHG